MRYNFKPVTFREMAAAAVDGSHGGAAVPALNRLHASFRLKVFVLGHGHSCSPQNHTLRG